MQLMYSSFQEVPGVFKFATAKNSNDLEEIQKFLDDAINDRSVDGHLSSGIFKKCHGLPVLSSFGNYMSRILPKSCYGLVILVNHALLLLSLSATYLFLRPSASLST
jgi:hypothetical protein